MNFQRSRLRRHFSGATPTRRLAVEQLENRRLLSVVGWQSSPLEPGIQGQAYSAPALVDFDGDGLTDLLVGQKTADGQGAVLFHRNVGSAELPQFAEGVPVTAVEAEGCLGVSLCAADFDADGQIDLVLGLSAGGVVWASGEPLTAEGEPIDVGRRPMVEVADFNDDGRPDLIVGALDGRIRVFLGRADQGMPDLAEPFDVLLGGERLIVPSGRSAPRLVDLNDDGLLDLLSGNTEGQLYFYANVGSNTAPQYAVGETLQSDGQPIDLPGRPRSRPAVGDINGDGLTDILVGAADGQVRLYSGEVYSETLATLTLLDAQREPFDLPITENTMVIGAATWCSASGLLRQWLADPELLDRLDDLDMVFVFGDESAATGATIHDPTFFEGLPGVITFLAAETPRPTRFPTVYDPSLGQFTHQTAFESIHTWLAAHDLASNTPIPNGPSCSDTAHSPGGTAVNSPGRQPWDGGPITPVKPRRGDSSASTDPVNHALATAAASLAPFDILTPTGTIGDDTPEITWQAAAGAYAYDLVIDDDADLASPLVLVEGLGGTSHQLTDPLPPGVYYVGVTAREDIPPVVDAGSDLVVNEGAFLLRFGSFSEEDATLQATNNGLAFNVLVQPPGAFLITAPAAPVNAQNATIVWQASERAIEYDLTVSTASDCSAPIENYTGLTVTTQTTGALANGAYYACVTARDADNGASVATNNGFSFEIAYVPPKEHTIFVSSVKSSLDPSESFPPPFPSWGGLDAADWTCTYLAYTAGMVPGWDGLAIVHKAILSTASANARDRINIEGQVITTGGQLVANTAADFWSSSHLAQIDTDEFGNTIVADPEVWTGTSPDGTWSTDSCGGWNDRNVDGTVGLTTVSSFSWAESGILSCGNQARLYCVSPGQTASEASTTGPGAPADALLTEDMLEAALARAVAYWAGQGIDTSLLPSDIGVDIGDLGDTQLGLTTEGVDGFRLDRDAAQWGWSTVETVPAERIDLVWGMVHEMGHLLELEHADAAAHDVMAATLAPGTRPTSLADWLAAEPGPVTAEVDYGEGDGWQPLVLNGDGSFGLAHQYTDQGVYTVHVRVNDDLGVLVAQDTFDVTVNNVAPITQILSADLQIDEGDTFTGDGLFFDPGDDTWTATVDYDDGAGPQPLSLNPDNTFTLNHQYTAPGAYSITVTVTDDDGAEGTDTREVIVLGPPAVTGVYFRGSTWRTTFLEELDDQGHGHATIPHLGFATPVGDGSQLDVMPWSNVNQIRVVFDQETVVEADDLTVLGVNTSTYALDDAAFSYDPVTFTATWSLVTPLFSADKLLLVLDSDSTSGVRSPNGVALDGEWTNPTDTTSIIGDTFPSGDGTAGGDFAFRVDMHPGNVNGDDRITFSDFFTIRARLGQSPGTSGYDVIHDLNGDARITFSDAFLSRARLGLRLPTGEPEQPSAGLTSPSSLEADEQPVPMLAIQRQFASRRHSHERQAPRPRPDSVARLWQEGVDESVRGAYVHLVKTYVHIVDDLHRQAFELDDLGWTSDDSERTLAGKIKPSDFASRSALVDNILDEF